MGHCGNAGRSFGSFNRGPAAPFMQLGRMAKPWSACVKPAAGRATQVAAMVITALLALVWVYFGVLYLIRNPGESRTVTQDLGYPLYLIPLIGGVPLYFVCLKTLHDPKQVVDSVVK